METNFNFKSQVCTDKIQSERLLSLGLKKETADIVLLREMVYDEDNYCMKDGEGYLIGPIGDDLEGEEHRGHIPAWSLGRLVEMCPKTIVIGLDSSNPFESIILSIEDIIKEGHFNKEYLV